MHAEFDINFFLYVLIWKHFHVFSYGSLVGHMANELLTHNSVSEDPFF